MGTWALVVFWVFFVRERDKRGRPLHESGSDAQLGAACATIMVRGIDRQKHKGWNILSRYASLD